MIPNLNVYFFHTLGSFFKGAQSTVSIGSCLKEELVNELSESIANYMFPGIVDTSSDDVTDVKLDLPNTKESQPAKAAEIHEISSEDQSKDKAKVEQDALYQRKRRDIKSDRKVKSHHKKSKIQPRVGSRKMLTKNPFWDIKLDTHLSKSRSKIPVQPAKKQFMTGMLHKRWRIPGKLPGVF